MNHACRCLGFQFNGNVFQAGAACAVLPSRPSQASDPAQELSARLLPAIGP